MLPLTSRRRVRRRSLDRRLTFLGIALFVTLLIIGGLTQVSRNSGAYDAATNRSFAAQVSAVATASNVTAEMVRHLMASLPTQDRQALQADLDSAVQQTAQQSAQAATFALPAPSSGISAQFATIFPDRAQAVGELRDALDGLLGMHPLPVAGVNTGNATVATPTLLSSTEATDRIAAAGLLLARSDLNYAALRRNLARSAGHAQVPKSTWITNRQAWQSAAVATQVNQIEASPSLAATHLLVLSVVGLSPPALPSPTGAVATGLSTLSPTRSLVVSADLTNNGSVDEPHATVHFTLRSQPAGRAVVVTRVSAVEASRSVALDPASFVVKPGSTYQLTVAASRPPGQTSAGGLVITQVLQIAPGTPTTTTTTTPPTKKTTTTTTTTTKATTKATTTAG